MPEDIDQRVNNLEKWRDDFEDRQAIIQARLDEDIKELKEYMHSNVGDIKDSLHEIKDRAFSSVPNNIANQLALHSLVWQILSAAAAIGLVVVTLYVTHR